MESHAEKEQPRGRIPSSLSLLDSSQLHTFLTPTKRINEGHDVPFFLTSKAYSDIGIFMMRLNTAMCPRKSAGSKEIQKYQLDDPQTFSEPVQNLQELLRKIDAIIEEAPPDTGPRRFGNISFRKWYEILESRVKDLLQMYLPKAVLEYHVNPSSDVSVLDELTPYLLGGFGSSQRLDYGTGHELSFLAFLGCIWKLGGFTQNSSSESATERSIVLGIIEPYLRVIRRLILTYTLEPAGSHGVWGLDDHAFLPYVFGSAQYCPAITEGDPAPLEGSLPNSPDPADVAKKNIVDRERKHNMYFAAVGFINDVKTGPFWEHSPILFDISGVKAGWGKINKGMIKMYNAEVLSKFPVVQHFPFGSLFTWEQDPHAVRPPTSAHSGSQPTAQPPSIIASDSRPSQTPRAGPAATISRDNIGSTAAPWAQKGVDSSSTATPITRVPWANSVAAEQSQTRMPPPSKIPDGPTRAPWAKR